MDFISAHEVAEKFYLSEGNFLEEDGVSRVILLKWQCEDCKTEHIVNFPEHVWGGFLGAFISLLPFFNSVAALEEAIKQVRIREEEQKK